MVTIFFIGASRSPPCALTAMRMGSIAFSRFFIDLFLGRFYSLTLKARSVPHLAIAAVAPYILNDNANGPVYVFQYDQTHCTNSSRNVCSRRHVRGRTRQLHKASRE